MAGGNATLLHGSRRKRGESDDVSCCVDVRNNGAIVFVDGDVAFIVDCQASLFESETIDSGATPGCEKDGFGFEFLSALHGKTRTGGKILDLDGAFVEPKMHAHSEKTITKAIGNFGIEKRKKPISAIDERNIHTKCREDGGVFATDNSATNDGEAFGNAIHVKKGIGIEGVNVVESNFRWAIGLGSGGNQDEFSSQTPRAIGTSNEDCMRICERSLTANEFNFVKCKILQNALAFHLDDGALMMHEIVDGEIFFQRVVNSIEAALLQAGKVEG